MPKVAAHTLALALLALAAVCGSADRAPAGLAHDRRLLGARDSLLNSRWVATDGAGQSAMSTLRSFPRYGGANHSVTYDREDSGRTTDSAYAYVWGLAIMIGIPIALSVSSMCGCLIFCLSRCACNCCGERQATNLYARKETLLARGLVCTLVVVLALTCAYGWSSNVGVSQGIEDVFSAVDGIIEYATEWTNLATTAAAIASDGLRLAKRMNRTINAVLPTGNEVLAYRGCVERIFNVTEAQNAILAQMQGLNDTVAGLPDFDAFGDLMQEYQDRVDELPNMVVLNTKIHTFNDTMAATPSIPLLSSQLVALNASLDKLRYQTSTKTDIANFDAAITAFDGAPLTESQGQYDAAEPLMSDADYLQLSGDIALAVGVAPISTFQLELRQLNLTINTMPHRPTYLARVRAMKTTLAVLQTSMRAVTSVQQLVDDIDAVPDLRGLELSLIGMRSFVTGTGRTQLRSIMKDIRQMNLSIKALPPVKKMRDFIDEVEAATIRIKAFQIETMIKTLQTVNKTVTNLNCIMPIFDVFTRINDTLVELPSGIDSLFDIKKDVQKQIDEQNKTQSQIDSGVSGLRKMNRTLNNLPDFAKMRRDISSVNKSLQAMPDLNKAYNDMAKLDNDMGNVPNITEYLLAIKRLNDTMHIAGLRPLLTRLQAINAALLGLDMTLYENDAIALNASTHKLQIYLQTAYDYTVNQAATYATNGLPNPPKAVFQYGVDQLRAAIAAKTPGGPLIAALATITASKSGLPDTTAVITDIIELEYASATFPSISKLVKELNNVQSTRNDQDGFNDLLNSRKLLDADQSIRDMGRLNDTRTQLDDVSRAINDTDIPSVIDQLSVKNSLTADQKADAIDKFDDLADLRDDMPDFDKYIGDGQKSTDSVLDQRDRMIAAKTDYYSQRNSAKNSVNQYDGMRLFIFNMIQLAPFAFSVLGLVGALGMYGCPAMVMALLFFPLISLQFLLAGMSMPVATLLSDHCDDPDARIKANFDGQILFNHTELSFFNLSRDITINEAYDYFANCIGPELEPLARAGQPRQILSDNGFNVTDIRFQVVHNSANLTLRPTVLGYFDDLDGLFDQAISLLLRGRDRLQCSRTSKVWIALRDGLCSSFAPQFALSTCMFIMSSLCMFPGIVCGIRGYKRFDKRNRLGAYNLQQDEEDPNAADYDDRYKERRQVWADD